MRTLGELCFLAAFIAAGYACFACLAGRRKEHRLVTRSGYWAGIACFASLTVTMTILASALLRKDFGFAYVGQYSSRSLPWHYSLSALWVGQAGSLLLWAWMLGLTSLVYGVRRQREPGGLGTSTFGILMGYQCFLLGVMVFGANPMEANLAPPSDGAGLTSLLHHPAMLIHPPVVFFGYTLWTIPFALASAGLAHGEFGTAWLGEIRVWSIGAWTVLGIGILLGAEWAYEELGWGGYWGWDPVENGSLIPWLTGTALIHCVMAWRHGGVLKKSAVALSLATFGWCNFATFLTRSGVFDSVHAFSQSPIGWMFLAFMAALALSGAAMIVRRRSELAPERRISVLWSREAVVLISALLLLLLAGVAAAGTAALPLSYYLLGRKAVVGAAFYNNVLTPVGLLLLAGTSLAPVLQWGRAPQRYQKQVLGISCGGAVVAAIVGLLAGVRHPVGIAVTGLATLTAGTLIGTLLVDGTRRGGANLWSGAIGALRAQRRQYAGYLVHLGFAMLVLGVSGSSLGTRRHEAVLNEGDRIQWAGRWIHYDRLIQRELPEKLIAEARLEVRRGNGAPVTLLPARHFHLLQNEWTTEVAINSTWPGDFYTILHSGEGDGRVRLTFIENPMMRWIWFGGAVMAAGAVAAVYPASKRTEVQAEQQKAPKRRTKRQRAPVAAR